MASADDTLLCAEIAPAGRLPGQGGVPEDDPRPILLLQSAAGDFRPGAALDQAIARAVTDPAAWRQAIAAAVKSAVSDSSKTDALEATVAAVLLLRTRFAERESLWRRASQKAVRHLSKVLSRSTEEVETWLGTIEATLPK